MAGKDKSTLIFHQLHESYVKNKICNRDQEMKLFETPENILKTEFSKIKRNFLNKPISAYNANDWFDFYKSLYEKAVGFEYPSTKRKDSMLIKTFVYPIVFGKYQWSARNFATFLCEKIKSTRKKDTPYLIAFISKDEHAISKYSEQIEKNKREKIFDRTIYLPHIPLAEEDNDVRKMLKIFDVYFDTTPIPIMFNYGIPIFHRFLQLERKMKFDDATKEIKKIILDKILIQFKKHGEVIELLCEGIVKNSILWEPYVEINKTKRNILTESCVIDWRKEFADIWKKFSLLKNDWWEPKESRSTYKIISGIGDFFDYKIRH